MSEINLQQTLRTSGEIADLLGVSFDRVRWLIATRRIPHAKKCGIIRQFDEAAVEAIRGEFDQIAERRRQPVARRCRRGAQ